MTPAAPRRSAFSAVLHALFYVFIFFTCQYMVTAGYMMSLMTGSLTMGGELDETAVTQLLEQTVGQAVMISLISNLLTILIICLIQTIRRRNPAQECGLRPVNLLRCPTFLLFGAALNVFVSGTISFLPLPEEVLEAFENQYAALYGETPLWLEILSIAVITGITEEVIFRGFVNSRLAHALPARSVILVSSIIFGLAHGVLVAVVYSALLGMVFCLMYEKFHSAIPSILAHTAFNATSYLLAAMDERWMLPVYLFSIAAVLFCTYRIFFRRPTFYDVATDMVGEYPLRDNVEREIMAEVRRMQEDGDISPEAIDRLAEAWETNERKYKKNTAVSHESEPETSGEEDFDNTDNDNNTKEN